MNKNKLLATTFSLALILGISNAFTQETKPLPPLEKGPAHHEEIKDKIHNELAEKLSLTDEQKKQAEEIRQNGHKKIKPLMKEMKTLREKMDKLRHENMEEFEKILNQEQKSKLEELKKNRPHKPFPPHMRKKEHRSFNKK